MKCLSLSGIVATIISERAAPPEQLVKCKLCEAVFYNTRAYDAHNLLHSPKDLYVGSEAERKLAVLRYAF